MKYLTILFILAGMGGCSPWKREATGWSQDCSRTEMWRHEPSGVLIDICIETGEVEVYNRRKP